ncbi:MAG: ComEC/Rec2 family competence protein [Candidatus Andersenbacteria bacterium]|nr:ComEC/Rec2 family competence protein [bacterium]MDZ4225430.1 ComEC/Rec2 family competence protein [Candidatus Andersenbacteria bacterium]
MRRVFLALSSGWLVGIITGVLGLSLLAAIILAVGWTVLCWLYNSQTHVAAAVLMLLLLGFVWGTVARVPTVGCVIGKEETVDITSRETRQNGTQYVVRSHGGCEILVYTSYRTNYYPGERIHLSRGSWQSYSEVAEKSPGFAEYLVGKNIGGVWSYPEVELSGGRKRILPYWRTVVAGQISKTLLEPEAGLAAAMITGEKGEVMTDLKKTLQAGGVSHVLAISGLHISLIAGAIYIVVSLLPFGPGSVGLVTGMFLWFYIVLVGAPISAVRAGLFWSLALLLLAMRRLVGLPTAIWVAALVTVSADPGVIKEVSWQLSFAAVAGIWLALFLTKKWRESRSSAIISLLLVSGGAFAATWPIVAVRLGMISPISIAVNLLVVPVVPAIMFFSAVTAVVSLLMPAAALWLAWVVHVLVAWSATVTDLLLKLPGSFWQEVSVPPVIWLTYYFLMFVLVSLVLKRQGRNWREIWE